MAVGLVVVPMLGTTTTTGCTSQETSPAPDANLPPCNKGPFIFCQPVGADQPSCNTDDGNSKLLTRLNRATRYPVGCVVDFVGDRDEQGDCKLEAVCKCIIGELPGQVPEGGTGSDGGSTSGVLDAGDAGDAGDASATPPPPPPPPAATGPVWNCYP